MAVTVGTAALIVAALALQMRRDELHAPGARWPLELAAALCLALAAGLPRAVLRGRRRAFVVRDGRFVAPASAALRATALAPALAAFALIPVAVRHNHVERIFSSDAPAIVACGAFGVLALAVAVRCRQYTVELDPGGVTVRTFASPPDRAPWERVRAGRVAGRAWMRALEPDLIERAVRHYRDHPEHRAAIGTEAEHARLAAALGEQSVSPGSP